MTPAQIDALIYQRTGIIVLDEDAEEVDPQDDRGFLLLEGLLLAELLRQNKGYKSEITREILRIIPSSLSPSNFSALISELDEAIERVSKIHVARSADIVLSAQQNIGKLTKKSVLTSIEKTRTAIEAPLPKLIEPRPLPAIASPIKPIFRTKITAPWLEKAIEWTADDTQAMQWLARNNALWMGKHFNDAQRLKASNIVTRDFSLFADNPAKLAQRIKAGLVNMVEATDAYWQTYATNALNYARSYSALQSFEKAGKTRYRIVAVIDSATTQVCRTLNGREFDVAPALRQFEQVTATYTVEDLDKVHPFLRDEKDLNGQPTGRHIYGPKENPQFIDANTPTSAMASAGIMAPPFHFNCRSRIEWID